MDVRTLQGSAVTPYLDDVARLRIEVFRDYPYLYEGSAAYEVDYLAGYAKSPNSIFVLALDGAQVVGASTGMPLADESEAFQVPFQARGIELSEVFYFGESVLRKAYRGRGLGHRFFDEREAHALRTGHQIAAFCAVERATDDPRRPADHRDNDVFWQKRGYQKQGGMLCTLEWKETGDAAPSSHSLCFWLRRLVD